MNILFVTHYTGLGGANIAMLNLIQQYLNRNIGVYVIFPAISGPLKDRLEEWKIPCASIPMPWWVCDKDKAKKHYAFRILKTYLSNYRAAIKLCSYIRRWNINIIHTNSTVVAAGALASRIMKLPHVWHLREDLSNYGWVFCLNSNAVKKWFSYSDKIIVISKACEMVYKKYLNPNKTVLIYDGAQVAAKQQSDIKVEKEFFHILYLGGMSSSKGYQDVLEAVDILRTMMVQPFKLWMPGCKENGITDRNLEKLLADRGLEIYVEPIEYLERKRLDQFRYAMNLFIMASSQEMFGLVTVEAMLSGVPVVASDTGANPEIIRNGENGYLYPCGDVERLVQTIKQIMSSDQTAVTEVARKEAQERYSMKACAERTIRVYQEFVKEK